MIEQDFKNIIKTIFRFNIVEENDINFIFSNNNNQQFTVNKERLNKTIQEINNYKIDDDYELYNDKYYEVSLEGDIRNMILKRNRDINSEDTTNNIKYELTQPSDIYLLIFLRRLHDTNTSMPLLNRRINRISDEYIQKDLLDLLKDSIPRLLTLKILSDSNKTKSEFEALSLSYLFHLSYNSDIAYIPSSILESYREKNKIVRRNEISDIQSPKKKYKNELVLYYQRAIFSDIAELKYLSFYHIIEYFFEQIYNENLIELVRNKLIEPAFSYKEDKDVEELIKVVKKQLKYNNETFQIKEDEALKLVLDKFIIDFDDIKNEINRYDDILLDYYKSKEVSFSKGNKVNFDEDRKAILANLSKRIYNTRNAIVHSKEGGKNHKYLPSKHDKILQKELFLIRLIAEKVIIGSGEMI